MHTTPTPRLLSVALASLAYLSLALFALVGIGAAANFAFDEAPRAIADASVSHPVLEVERCVVHQIARELERPRQVATGEVGATGDAIVWTTTTGSDIKPAKAWGEVVPIGVTQRTAPAFMKLVDNSITSYYRDQKLDDEGNGVVVIRTPLVEGDPIFRSEFYERGNMVGCFRADGFLYAADRCYDQIDL